MGMTVLRVLGTTMGKAVSRGSSLGQEFDGVVTDGSLQEGLERLEGSERGGGEVQVLGGLGWPGGVHWKGMTTE